MHQFQWSPCTGGNGVPRWSCENGGYAHDALGGFNAQHDFWQGALAPDGRTLLEHFYDVWRVVARWYRRDRVVAGFNFLNEPLTLRRPSARGPEAPSGPSLVGARSQRDERAPSSARHRAAQTEPRHPG
jgi:hypothetical protein